jgi:hypothetical protein
MVTYDKGLVVDHVAWIPWRLRARLLLRFAEDVTGVDLHHMIGILGLFSLCWGWYLIMVRTALRKQYMGLRIALNSGCPPLNIAAGYYVGPISPFSAEEKHGNANKRRRIRDGYSRNNRGRDRHHTQQDPPFTNGIKESVAKH